MTNVDSRGDLAISVPRIGWKPLRVAITSKKMEVSSEVGIFVVDSQQIVEGITAHYCHRIKKTEVTMRVRFS